MCKLFGVLEKVFGLLSSPSPLPEKDLYQQANVNTSDGQGREEPAFKCEVVFRQREMEMNKASACMTHCWAVSSRPNDFRFHLRRRDTVMLPRSMKTSGVELPGVGSRDVPLIGYRPLQPGPNGPSDQPRRENENREADPVQVRHGNDIILIMHCTWINSSQQSHDTYTILKTARVSLM